LIFLRQILALLYCFFKRLRHIAISILYKSSACFSNLYKHSAAFCLNAETTKKEKKRMPQMVKFVQSLDQEIYDQLEAMAKERGITIQALIRNIIGEWLLHQPKPERKPEQPQQPKPEPTTEEKKDEAVKEIQDQEAEKRRMLREKGFKI
jgi:hypothetical protein